MEAQQEGDSEWDQEPDDREDALWRGQSFEAARTFDRSIKDGSFARARQEQATVFEEECDVDEEIEQDREESIDAWKRAEPKEVQANDTDEDDKKNNVACLPGPCLQCLQINVQRLDIDTFSSLFISSLRPFLLPQAYLVLEVP